MKINTSVEGEATEVEVDVVVLIEVDRVASLDCVS